MPRETFRIEGLSDLDEALSELPKAVARNVLVRVLKAVGVPIRDDGERNAPRLTGGLKLTYTISQKLSRRQRKQNRKESAVEVYVGPGPHPKGVQTEFGNAHQAAEPHLRPAFDANARGVMSALVKALAEEIDKTVKRRNKRAERLAAKIAAQK